MLDIKSKFSTAFQPPTDGQINVVNKSLCKSLHDIVYGFTPKHLIYLISMVNHNRVCIIIKIFESASLFASLHVHKLYKKINDKITRNNANCKLRMDVRKRYKTFNVDDDLHA